MKITREDFENKTFKELAEMLSETRNDIISYDVLKEFAIKNIEEDYLHMALFILNSMYDNNAHFPADTDWYQYDFCIGTCMQPRELNTKDDIEEFFEFEED